LIFMFISLRYFKICIGSRKQSGDFDQQGEILKIPKSRQKNEKREKFRFFSLASSTVSG